MTSGLFKNNSKSNLQEYLDKMYNSNELPKRRKIEPDEFADLLCSGEMIFIKEEQISSYPKHRNGFLFLKLNIKIIIF